MSAYSVRQIRGVVDAGYWPHRIRTLVLHHRSHIEEVVALMDVLRNPCRFPGAREAGLMLTKAGLFTPDGRPVKEWEVDGYLPIGVWGSIFDEHSLPTEVQEGGISAATLVSFFSGSFDDMAWRPVVKYVSENDSKGHAGSWDLPALVLKMHDYLEFQSNMARRIGGEEISEAQRFQRVFKFVSFIVEAQYAKNRGDLEQFQASGFWSDPAEYVAFWLIRRFGKKYGMDACKQENLIARLWTPQREPQNRVKLHDGIVQNVADAVDNALGMTKSPPSFLFRLSTIIDFAKRDSMSGAAGPWDFATLVSDAERYLRFKGGKFEKRDERAEFLGNIVELVLNSAYNSQCEYAKAAEEIVLSRERNAAPVVKEAESRKRMPSIQYFPVRGTDKRRRCLAVICGAGKEAHKAVHLFDPKPSVVITKSKRGNVTIFAPRFLNLDEVHQELLKLESEVGRSDIAPERIWMHFKRRNANNIMNGGLSAPGIPPTHIPLRLIVRSVRKAMCAINRPAIVRKKTQQNTDATLESVVGKILLATTGYAG